MSHSHHKSVLGGVIIAVLLAMTPSSNAAGPLGFEKVLGQVSVEGTSISNQFARTHGMSFRFTNGVFPFIVRKGYPSAGWGGSQGEDTLRSANAAAFGEGFLGHPTGTYTFIIEFAQPVSFVSGFAIDVDERPGMTIAAYSDDGMTKLAETLVRPTSIDAGDSLPAPWRLQVASKQIRQVRLTAIHRMALDNLLSDFEPEAPQTPEISAAWGMLVRGEVGRGYQVQFKRSADQAAWTPLADLELASPTYFFQDPEAATEPHRIYRVVGLP